MLKVIKMQMKGNNVFSKLYILPSILVLILVLVGLIIPLNDFPGVGVFEGNVMAAYILNMIAVVLSLLVIYFGLRLFKYKRFSDKLSVEDETQGRDVYKNWSSFVLLVFCIMVIADVLIAYVLKDLSAMWCALMVVVGSFFSIPSESKFQKIRNQETSTK